MQLPATTTKILTSAAVILGLSAVAQAGDEIVMPMAPAPAPSSSCDCANPGWTVEATALYLQVGATEGDGDGIDAEFAWRGSIAYELQSGLFFEATYFDFSGNYYSDSYDLDITNIDFMVGDRICCGDKLAVEIAAGLRYSKFEEESEADIDGFGPVISIEAQRNLAGPWSLYAGITQALIIGQDDYEDYDNSIYGITEIAAGIQYDFSSAYVRLGGEAQYYFGAAEDDTQDLGLFGGALTVGFQF